jgi:hypothetical protein
VSLAEKSTAELRELVEKAKADAERAWRLLHEAQAEINRRVTWAARDRLARLDEKGRPIGNPTPFNELPEERQERDSA